MGEQVLAVFRVRAGEEGEGLHEPGCQEVGELHRDRVESDGEEHLQSEHEDDLQGLGEGRDHGQGCEVHPLFGGQGQEDGGDASEKLRPAATACWAAFTNSRSVASFASVAA